MSDPSSGFKIPQIPPAPKNMRSVFPMAFGVEVGRALTEAIASSLGADEVLVSGRQGPDIVVEQGRGDLPLAIELKVWRYVPQNLNNRIAEALSNAVLHRREFPGGVQLTLLVIFAQDIEVPSGRDIADRWKRIESLSRLVRRANDDAGFERVIVGLGGDQDEWTEVEANGELRALTGFSGVVARLRERRASDGEVARHSTAFTVGDANAAVPPKILLIADEWRSHLGGISTFNRELAIALADAACEVHVVVPEAEQDERDEALERGVTLVTPDPIPGVKGQQLLLTRPRFSEDAYYPDVVVGHGRILGPYAYAVRNLFFPDAKRLHVVHTDPERLEMVKAPQANRSAVLTADERKQLEVDLSISADLVAGVGPLLTEMIRDAMRGYYQTPPHVVDIRPGLYDWGGTVNPEDPPERRQVLLIARTDDIRSKGIDIAVQAVTRAVGRFDSDSGDPPVLVVRGVPESEADVVKQQLDAIVASQATVLVRPHSADRDSLRRDLWQSRLVIMPSRHEGFGLVSIEAISAGVPVLVSRDSGVGRVLREIVVDGERGEPREVVPVSRDDNEVAQVWGDAIYERLVDPESAFRRAADVRRQLDQGMNWSQTVGLLLAGLGLAASTVQD